MTHQPLIEIKQHSYPLQAIDAYGFSLHLDLAESTQASGVLILLEEQIPVDFRVRENENGLITCSFSNLTIANSKKLAAYLRKRQRGFVEGDMDSHSYDELASGLDIASTVVAPPEQSSAAPPSRPLVQRPTTDDNTPASPAIHQPIEASTAASASTGVAGTNNSAANDQPSGAKSNVKSLAVLIMMFSLLGLLVLAVYFLRSRSTLTVNNSALVGNYLPVNVKVDGEIVEIMVEEGDSVEQGDVLLRLSNPEMEMERERTRASLNTAEVKVQALQNQVDAYESRLKIAEQKIDLDLEVARLKSESADKLLIAAQGELERLGPSLAGGAITQIEFDVEQNEFLAAEAAALAAENQIKQLEFSKEAISNRVLIYGDRVDDSLTQLVADLEVAKAEVTELKMMCESMECQFAGLEVTAPRSGQVYAAYRQVGEFVKVADETIGLSFDGRVWASGQVSSSQARRVRPGQPVSVSAPSLGRRFDGVVMAVGHRSLYSHGRYTADFRTETATDVPIKVLINDLPNDVPSGIRLEMAINTGFGVPWLDQALGYELKPISEAPKAVAEKEDDDLPSPPDVVPFEVDQTATAKAKPDQTELARAD